MFLTVHSTAGIALGTMTGNPILAFVMGFLSHLILDITPHGDEMLGRWAERDKKRLIQRYSALFILDITTAGILIYALFGDLITANPYPLLAGTFGAILPDILAGFVKVFPNKLWNWYETFHAANHTLLKHPIHWKYGFSLQLLTLALLSYQLLK